jgi:HD-like signal output (HDOD) protein
MGTVRGFALASIIKKSFTLDLSVYGITNEMFSELSKRQHALITAWCMRKENKLMGILSPAAFLVEIGKVIIAQQVISEGKQVEFENALKEFQDVEKAEEKVVGVNTPEVSAMIFKLWKFEDGLVDVIKNSQDPQNAEDEDKKAAQILQVVRTTIPINGVATQESIANAKELITNYDLDMQGFETALESAAG